MEVFFIVCLAFVLLGTLAWLWSIHINPQVNAAEQQALAQEQVNTYRLRLKELAHEHQLQGLDDQEYQGAVNDLKRQTLYDLRLATSIDDKAKGGLLLPGMAFLVLFVGAFYYANGESAKLTTWQEAKVALPDLGARALQGKGEQLSPAELQKFALALRSKLHDTGEDPNAWVILGRVTMALEDPDSAMMAFERAYRLDPKKPAVLLGLSQLLLMTGEDADMRRAAMNLSELLTQQPNNIDGLMMVGYIAEQMGDMDKARMSWQILQRSLPEGDPRADYINQKLAGPTEGSAGGSLSQVSDKGSKVAGAKVKVQLSLASEVKQQLPTGGTLFIYAKSVGGRPMPAAVVKLNQFNFPMTVELSDQNAMLQDYKLSSLENAVIWARVSVDEDIGVSAGELQGQSGEFMLKDTQSVNVVIDQIL